MLNPSVPFFSLVAHPWVLPTLSALGESLLLLPAALVAGAWMAWAYGGRTAARFLAALAVCGLVLAGGKLVFLSCGSLWQAGLSSPSGHAGLSLFVYGALALVSWRALPVGPARLLGPALVALALAIAWSRVRSGAHNSAEVVVGIGVGLLCLISLFGAVPRRLLGVRAWAGLVLPLMAVGALLVGLRSDVESRIRMLAHAGWVRQALCPLPPHLLTPHPTQPDLARPDRVAGPVDTHALSATANADAGRADTGPAAHDVNAAWPWPGPPIPLGAPAHPAPPR